MADGAYITGQVDLRKTMRDLFDLPEKEQKSIIRKCAKEAAPKVLSAHYDKNSGSWPEKRDGGQQLVGKTGDMMTAIQSAKSPHRKVTVAKDKKAKDRYRIKIYLRKMVDGTNIYRVVQRGKVTKATAKGFFGRKTINIKDAKKNKGVQVERAARMVAQNEPGDVDFFTAPLEEAYRAYMVKKAKKAARAAKKAKTK